MKNIKRNLTLIGLTAVLAVGAVSVSFAQRGNGGGGRGGNFGPMGHMMHPKPFIGIQFEPVEGGMKVVQVLADSPAETAGLLVDDVITAVNGTAIGDGALRDTIGNLAAGDVVELSVTRGEESLTLSVTLDERPLREIVRGHGQARIGAVLEEGTLNVTEVAAGSPAEAAGLQAGDTISAINGTAVTTRAEVLTALNAAHEAAAEDATEIPVTVTVTRDGAPIDLSVTLPTRQGLHDRFPNMPGLGRGLRGLFIEPRADGSGFDVVIPFTLSEGTTLSTEAQAAIEGLGWSVQPKEGEEGVYELTIPAESVKDGLNLDALEGIEGLGNVDVFAFGMPEFSNGMDFSFAIPEGAVIPAAPADAGAEL